MASWQVMFVTAHHIIMSYSWDKSKRSRRRLSGSISRLLPFVLFISSSLYLELFLKFRTTKYPSFTDMFVTRYVTSIRSRMVRLSDVQFSRNFLSAEQPSSSPKGKGMDIFPHHFVQFPLGLGLYSASSVQNKTWGMRGYMVSGTRYNSKTKSCPVMWFLNCD